MWFFWNKNKIKFRPVFLSTNEGNVEKLIEFLIDEHKKTNKNNSDCNIEDYKLTPETILFICIRNSYPELLANIKKKGFIQEGNSETYILPNSS